MQKKTCPDFVPPMMAHSAKEPFDSRDWIFVTSGYVFSCVAPGDPSLAEAMGAQARLL
jgi:hypothetical protein